jgi:hypothetical protein
MEFRPNIYGILLMVAGLVALISVFLAWVSFWGFSISGWEFFNDYGFIDDWKTNIPLIVMILAIVAIVFALLEFTGISFDAQIQRIIVMMIGALIVVLTFIFVDGEFDYVGIGMYLAIIAGLLLVIVPLLVMLRVLPEY